MPSILICIEMLEIFLMLKTAAAAFFSLSLSLSTCVQNWLWWTGVRFFFCCYRVEFLFDILVTDNNLSATRGGGHHTSARSVDHKHNTVLTVLGKVVGFYAKTIHLMNSFRIAFSWRQKHKIQSEPTDCLIWNSWMSLSKWTSECATRNTSAPCGCSISNTCSSMSKEGTLNVLTLILLSACLPALSPACLFVVRVIMSSSTTYSH